MTFTVIGSGGIGGFFGLKLLNAGHRVIFIARNQHLRTIQRDGLTLVHPDLEFNGNVEAHDLETYLSRYPDISEHVLLLATKAMATEGICKQLAQHPSVPMAILSMQNGVDNEPLLASYFGREKIIGGISRKIGAHISAPGTIKASGIAELLTGPYPSTDQNPLILPVYEQIADIFKAAGIAIIHSDHVEKELWMKLVINNGVNPLTALTGLSTRGVSTHPQLSKIVYGMMLETMHAAQQHHIAMDTSDVDAMFQLIRNFEPIKTSMLIDMEKGRELELDTISGIVIDSMEEKGLQAPFTQTVKTLLELKKMGQKPFS
jgi:2-dehydropantoate 2-reductase